MKISYCISSNTCFKPNKNGNSINISIKIAMTVVAVLISQIVQKIYITSCGKDIENTLGNSNSKL